MRNEYEYEPIYLDTDLQSNSERIREFGVVVLLTLLGLAAGWFIGEIFILLVPESMPVLYLPINGIRQIGKWGSLVALITFGIVEIIGIIARINERRAGEL